MSKVLHLIVGLLVMGVIGTPLKGIENKNIEYGDMILSPEQYRYLFWNETKRHGTDNKPNHWPKGLVSYKFAKDVSDSVKSEVLNSMKLVQDVSCIRFEEAKPGVHHVIIREGNKCAALVGYQKNQLQTLTLNDHCRLSNSIHEIFHTLGFYHMHTAMERDNYVKIDYENIVPRFIKNFEKYTKFVSMFDTPYDFNSIMHYPRRAYAIDKKRMTIIPLMEAPYLGQRKRMSKGDILRLNRMYNCKEMDTKTAQRLENSLPEVSDEFE